MGDIPAFDERTPPRSEAVDISTTDHTFSFPISAIYIGTVGTVIARLRGDSVDRTYLAAMVFPGMYLLGDFEVVRRTGTTAASMIGVSDR